MRIGLIDVDGHHFPNLALMRISAWHKANGDQVEWWWTDLMHYDIVYKSKIFSDAYTKDVPDPLNVGRIVKGGTGYSISLQDGREVFCKETHKDLPTEVEKMFPDYSIYPQYHFAVAMTSRGCPRGCTFCHVAAKEGRWSHKVADVSDFWCGQKHIEVLDPNITACKDKHDLFQQYAETKATVNFNQGLDIRLLTEQDIEDINRIRVKEIHFAWDNPADDLEQKFRDYARMAKWRPHGRYGVVYVLVNHDSTMEENLHRIYLLRSIQFDPYVMIYDKPNAPREIRLLQRWCNNKFIMEKCKRFEDFNVQMA